MADKNFKVKTGLTLPSPLSVDQGGTGQTTATNTLNALLPVQTDNANKVLKTDGTNTSWVAQAVAYQRGGTASRPASPTAGDLYYNTDNNYFEQYTSLGWFPIASAPGIPTGVTATNQPSARAFNNGQMSVAFTPNANAGAPSSFIVTPTPTTSPSTFTGTSSPISVTGLSSSTSYTYTVSATSPYGTSSASSASTGVTATTVPQAPTIGTATASTYNTTSVSFTPGSTGGETVTYTVTSSSGITNTGASSPIVITETTAGSKTYTVAGTNSNGTSLSSVASNSINIQFIPSAPTIGVATQNQATSINVSYTANSGGAPTTTFTATSSPGGLTGTGASPITVSGLTTGTAYTFTVTATNANGTSSASAASNSVVADEPWPNTDTFALISHQSLSSNQSSVTFNTLNPKYTDLYLIVNARTDNSSAKDQLLIQMNSDTNSSNYSSGYNMWDGNNSGGSFIGTRTVTTPGIRFAGLAGASATGTLGGLLEIDFVNFSNSSSNKTVIAEGGMTDINGSNPNGTVGSFAGTWYNTNACSSITLKPVTGTNFSSNSTFTLYGVTRNGGYGS
jgi:hypothetical protein